MEDYNNQNQNGQTGNPGLFNKVKEIAKKFDGKSQSELLSAIYDEAKRCKNAGTLKNSDIDKFALIISPFLDEKKKRTLSKLVEELKKI